MLRDDGISLIQQALGFRTDQHDQLVTNLKAVQRELETGPTKPWFLLSEETTTTTTAGERRILLPGDFILEHEENGLRYIPDDTDADPVRMTKLDLDQLEDYYLLSAGSPQAYSIDGGYIRLFPLPDDVYTISMLFYQFQTDLSSNIENEWMKWVPFLLLGKAGLLLAAGLRDAGATSIFQSWISEGMAKLYRENEARKHTNSSYQIGGPEA